MIKQKLNWDKLLSWLLYDEDFVKEQSVLSGASARRYELLSKFLMVVACYMSGLSIRKIIMAALHLWRHRVLNQLGTGYTHAQRCGR